jgi:hypothetical protein
MLRNACSRRESAFPCPTRTVVGVHARVGQRLLALAACIWWNWQLGVPDKRSLVAYDH